MKRICVAFVMVAMAAAPALVVAQADQAAAAAAKALVHVPPPTGPLSAITKAASAVRAARTAALSATRNAGAAATNAALGRTTSIVGYLWGSNNGALSNATVQLRNTVTGAVAGVVKTDVAGQFLFTNIDSGEYAVEYVSDGAKNLIALGHPFAAAPGETVATFVRLANQIPVIVPDLASNVAASAVQTAASAGVTAIVTPIAPVVDAPPPTPTVAPVPDAPTPPTVSVPPAASGFK